MNWWDFVFIGISAVCTFFSINGAKKSNTYYKKSKQLTIYANTNIAYTESRKIITTLTELLKLANIKTKRGTNYIRSISKYGESIKTSINKIRESLPVEDFNEIKLLLNDQEPKVEEYIDSLITGTVLNEEMLLIDDDFNVCQQIFCDIQVLIKKKLELISEKLK